MAKTNQIDIPHDPSQPDARWRPRDYQLSVWEYLENGGKKAIEIWHRRAGKDEVCLHWACVAAHERVGNYWHMLPEASQARKAIWDAIDPHRNLKRIDIAFPEELRKNTRNSDMFIEFKNGSTWQVVGSDNFNSLVGSPPVGIVFSEWALADPYSWAYLKPILEDNGGWVLFITTSRGPNHAKRMYDAATTYEDWHASLLPATETGRFTEIELARIRQDYIDQFGETVGMAMYEQEYLCSFEAAILGAVYGKEMREARQNGRIGSVPYDPQLMVESWWDLGYRDSTAIWFIQRVPKTGELRAIDYYEMTLAGIDHYAKVLQDKPYVYDRHLAPHDAAKGEVGSGLTLVEQAAKVGLQLTVRPITPLEAGISATRPLIRRMAFDANRCERGLDALSQYRYEWDDKRQSMSPKPVHDWASHGADALRTGANVGPKLKRQRPEIPKVAVI